MPGLVRDDPMVSTPEILCIKQFLQDVQDAKWWSRERDYSDMKRERLIRDKNGIQDVWVPESQPSFYVTSMTVRKLHRDIRCKGKIKH